MTANSLLTCGIVLLTIVAIAFGGQFLLRVRAGNVPSNELQRASFRAGHAHAGVLVTLGLVVQLLTAQPSVPAWAATTGTGVLWAAILIPAGFFLSVIGKDPDRRNAWRFAIGAGALSLLIGVIGSGAGLIIAAAQAMAA